MKINKYYSVSYIGNSRFLVKRTKYPRFSAVAIAENDKWKSFTYVEHKSKELFKYADSEGVESTIKFVFESKDAANAYYCWLNLTKRRVLNLEINGKRLFTIVFPWWATKSEREKYFKKFVNI